MWPSLIVISPPPLRKFTDLFDIAEDVGIQDSPAVTAVKAFNIAVLGRLSWLAFSKDGAFTLPALIVVPAFTLWIRILRSNGAAYNKCLIAAGLLNLCYYLLCVFAR